MSKLFEQKVIEEGEKWVDEQMKIWKQNIINRSCDILFGVGIGILLTRFYFHLPW